MATINGTKALGLEKEIGSLEVGKNADFAVIDASELRAAPYDPSQVENGGAHVFTTVVHSCDGRDVVMVVVNGVLVVDNSKLISVDEEDVKLKAREAIVRIRERSGVKAQQAKLGWNCI